MDLPSYLDVLDAFLTFSISWRTHARLHTRRLRHHHQKQQHFDRQLTAATDFSCLRISKVLEFAHKHANTASLICLPRHVCDRIVQFETARARPLLVDLLTMNCDSRPNYKVLELV